MVLVGQGACRARAVPACWPPQPRSRSRSEPSRTTGTASPSCIPPPRGLVVSTIGFVPGEGGKDVAAMMGQLDVLFLLGADEMDMDRIGQAFTVYIGTHGDAGAHRRTSSCRSRLHGKVRDLRQHRRPRAADEPRGFAPGDAKEDWAILRALSEVLGKKLPFDSLAQLRGKLTRPIRIWRRSTRSRPADAGAIASLAAKSGSLVSSAFASPVKDFYLTNPIARASAVMAECSAWRATVSGRRPSKATWTASSPSTCFRR